MKNETQLSFLSVARARLERETAPYAPDSDTSKAAAEYITPFTSTLRAKVYAKIFVSGAYGATADELAHALGIVRNSAAPRCTELQEMKLIRDSGRRRKVLGQRVASVVWILKEVAT